MSTLDDILSEYASGQSAVARRASRDARRELVARGVIADSPAGIVRLLVSPDLITRSEQRLLTQLAGASSAAAASRHVGSALAALAVAGTVAVGTLILYLLLRNPDPPAVTPSARRLDRRGRLA